MRLTKVIFTTVVLSTMMTVTAFAGTWKTGDGANQSRWWYDNENGTYVSNGWQWIDGNGDGIAECYYFDGEGWLLTDTTTPDGYLVNADGAWVNNGIVETSTQMQATETTVAKGIAETDNLSNYVGKKYRYMGVSSYILNENTGNYELFASSASTSYDDFLNICPYEYISADLTYRILSIDDGNIVLQDYSWEDDYPVGQMEYKNDGDKWVYNSGDSYIWYIALENTGGFEECYVWNKLNVDTGFGWPVGATVMIKSFYEAFN